MTEGVIVGCDLHRKPAHKFVLKGKVMPGLVFNRNHLFARILCLAHGYSFPRLQFTSADWVASPQWPIPAAPLRLTAFFKMNTIGIQAKHSSAM